MIIDNILVKNADLIVRLDSKVLRPRILPDSPKLSDRILYRNQDDYDLQAVCQLLKLSREILSQFYAEVMAGDISLDLIQYVFLALCMQGLVTWIKEA